MVTQKQIIRRKVLWGIFTGLVPVRSRHVILSMSKLNLKNTEVFNSCHPPILKPSLWMGGTLSTQKRVKSLLSQSLS